MNVNFRFKFLIFFFTFLFFLTSINSVFYADLKIDVKNNGNVDIFGNTNYNNFINISNSPEFVSKKHGLWTLNISSKKNEIFEDFVFELKLPANTQITYIKTTPSFRIENTANRIKIIGTGSNKPFTLIVQYKILASNSSFFKDNYIILLLVFFIILIIGFVSYFGFKLLRKENDISKEVEDVLEDSKILHPDVVLKNKKYDLKNFPERQQEIIKLLQKYGNLTQDEIRLKMNIPKSSISRNVKSLEIKSIVSIKDFGRYNKIILNEKKLK